MVGYLGSLIVVLISFNQQTTNHLHDPFIKYCRCNRPVHCVFFFFKPELCRIIKSTSFCPLCHQFISLKGIILLENICFKMNFCYNPLPPLTTVSSCLTPAGGSNPTGQIPKVSEHALLLCSQFKLT